MQISFGGTTQGFVNVIGTFVLPVKGIITFCTNMFELVKIPKLKGSSYAAPVEKQSRYNAIEILY